MLQQTLSTLSQTDSFARALVEWISPKVIASGVCIALEGELGSGKTTFVAALLKNLNSLESVSSPTYILEHRYLCPSEIRVHHWDLYRIPAGATPDDLLEPVVKQELRLIEWASKSKELGPLIDLQLKFGIISESDRSLEIEIFKKELKDNLQDLRVESGAKPNESI